MGRSQVVMFTKTLAPFEGQMAMSLYESLCKLRERRRKTVLWAVLGLETIVFSVLSAVQLFYFPSVVWQAVVIGCCVVALVSCLLARTNRSDVRRLKSDLKDLYANCSQMIPPGRFDQELAGGKYGTRVFWGAVAGLRYNDGSMPDQYKVQKLLGRF